MNQRRTHGKMVKKAGVYVDLTKRDRLVLKMLAKARVMRTSDFCPLPFPSLPIARRRLRKLHDGGYLCCFIEQLHEDNRWVLDAKGYQVLEGMRSEKRAPRGIAELSDHRATIVRFWSLLVHQCHENSTLSLQRFSFEWELPGEIFTTAESPRPDALLVLAINDGPEQTLLIEVDTGTESPSYVAKKKLALLERLITTGSPVAGVVPDGVLFLVPSERRLRSLARAIDYPTPSSRVVVFAHHATQLPRPWEWLRFDQVPTTTRETATLTTTLDREFENIGD